MENGSIQISAPSVEEAIAQGLARLGLSRENVEIEIVDQGSKGILGIGARDATVHISPKQQPAPFEPQGAEPLAVAEPAAEAEEPVELVSETAEHPWSSDQVADVARQTISELLGKMGIDCQVNVRREAAAEDEPAPLILDIEGDDVEALIGRQGEVLNALQYITRLIVSREVEHWVNLVVDVERYKERRARSLKQLASRIAERVARTRQPVALEPMPPNERRTIHIALRDHPSVTTQSVGKGDRRKVTIIPKR
jgi:spoIIIJ-associated protein